MMKRDHFIFDLFQVLQKKDYSRGLEVYTCERVSKINAKSKILKLGGGQYREKNHNVHFGKI